MPSASTPTTTASAAAHAPASDFLTVRDLMRLLGKSESTIRRKIEAGVFPCVQLGGKSTSVLVRREDFETAINALKRSRTDKRSPPNKRSLRRGRGPAPRWI